MNMMMMMMISVAGQQLMNHWN